jgi:phosphoglycerate dehydrogenase-like enzyme
MVRIAILDDYPNIARQIADWDGIPGAEIVTFTDHLAEPNRLCERLLAFDVVQMTRERTPFPATVLERLPDLKLLSGNGRRQSHVDMETASKLGIIVTGTGGSGGSTAELAWGLIIGIMRHIPWEDQAMRMGRWQTRLGDSLGGKTLGILGMGNIGTRMATIAQLFDMKVIAWGPTLTAERASASGATFVAWDELFSRADVLTIHVPLTDLSRGWVTENEFELMKPSAYLVNTSRGPIVDERALIDALVEHRIAGAALDVYDQEPLPSNHPLLSLDNNVLSPHLGYVSRQGLGKFFSDAVDNIKAWIAGDPTNVLNEDALKFVRKL